MMVKGLDKSYLLKTKMSVEEIVRTISYELGKNIKQITILSAGWDGLFGNYAVIRAGGNIKWIVLDGDIQRDNGWIAERCL